MQAFHLAFLLLSSAGGPAIAAEPPPVMLANVYDEADIELADYWVSEKYDGVRAWWDGRRLLTRGGNVIHAPDWFIAGWPRTPLDGELWVGRRQFEGAASTVLDGEPDEAAWRKVKYMVFDLPAHGGAFTERLAALNDVLRRHSIEWVQPVAQFKVESQAALRTKLEEVVAAGGEGVMLHRGGSRYRAERNDDLLKLKPDEDAEATVIGHTPGEGKYEGMLGALIVERPDGLRFRIGSGFTDEQRSAPPEPGACVTYAYAGFTAKGVPRFARFLRVRPDGCGS